VLHSTVCAFAVVADGLLSAVTAERNPGLVAGGPGGLYGRLELEESLLTALLRVGGQGPIKGLGRLFQG